MKTYYLFILHGFFIITRAPFSIHLVNVEKAFAGNHVLVRIEPGMGEQLPEGRTSFLSRNKWDDVMNLEQVLKFTSITDKSN